MNRDEWRAVIARLSASQLDLREPAAGRSLSEVEAALRRPLPESFRHFLELHDGGKVGELVIYGTEELRRGGPSSEIETLPSHLIPFHPVSPDGEFECFDTSRPDDGEYPVVWYVAGTRTHSDTTYMDFTDWFFDHLLDLADRVAVDPRRN